MLDTYNDNNFNSNNPDNFPQSDEIDLDYKLISNIGFENVDMKDYPDFCDAYVSSADYNGQPLSERELDYLNEDRSWVYEQLMERLFQEQFY